VRSKFAAEDRDNRDDLSPEHVVAQQPDIECVLSAKAINGESPNWSAADKRLYCRSVIMWTPVTGARLFPSL
jgi:sugar lactone lactonase YvrE